MEQYIAQIALAAATYAIDQPYHYLVPEELRGRVAPGMRVLVPFGAGNRRTDGVVLSLSGEPPAGHLKSILTILDDEPVLDHDSLQLALWLRERCFCTVYEAARVLLPSGLWFSLKDCWYLVEGVDREQAYAAAGRSERARHLVELLYANGGRAEMEQIRTAFGTKDPQPAIRQLAGQGVIALETSASRGIGDKTEQIAVLAVTPEEAMAKMSAGRGRARLQFAVTQLLCSLGSASVKELCYFTGASRATVRALEKKGILTLEKRELLRAPPTPPRTAPAPLTLNPEQEAAFQGLAALSATGEPQAALLYGVTGSGKTLVYLKLISSVLERGRTALLLVPEIGLTPQLMHRFTSYFGNQIAVFHSSLSSGERYDAWKRAKRGEARVVIGTRSAVFAPLPDLGLIILDEEQEGSYQSEQVPRYHARDVAKYRCVRSKALLVLGSATPSVETMYQAKSGRYHLFRLTQRFNQRALPEVTIVDLKEELRQGNGGSISAPLRQALEENIRRGEQSILFLNRRGSSKLVTCGECGYVPECPNCSVHLTYHSANHRLMCHYCGYSEPLPRDCPVCGGLFTFVGAGTQKVEEELHELFPGTEILRMDTDTVSASRSHEKLLSRFQRQNIPILVGTQMVAKGLDFENVTLVGVIAADLSLYVDDYRAGERTFSLLTQVVGRAGRGSKRGRALIQTWTPDNEVITCAAQQDYDSFYQEEIQLRQLRRYPPFTSLFRLTATGQKEEEVIRCCERLKAALLALLKQPEYEPLGCRLLGPSPAAVVRVNQRYRYRLTLSGPNNRTMRVLIAHIVRTAQTDKRNRGVSLHADLDPQNQS